MTAQDMTDPDRLNKIKWGQAISEWLDGYALLLRPLLNDASVPIPDFAREFLADLSEGKAHKNPGRRAERPGWLERSIVAEVYAKWEYSSKEAACADVAESRGTTAKTVSKLVEKLCGQGLTRERWIAWGRPDFKRAR